MLRKWNRSPKAKEVHLERKWLVLLLTCLLFKHALELSTLCILFVKSSYKTLELHQMTGMPQKYATNYSYLQGLISSITGFTSLVPCIVMLCVKVQLQQDILLKWGLDE